MNYKQIKNSVDNTLASLVVLSVTDNVEKSSVGLQSLLNLSDDLNELVFVLNGGSVEFFLNRFPILSEMPKERIKIINSIELLNFGPALNIGLRVIDSNWIMRADPDDINLENRIDLFNKMLTQADFDVFYTSVYIYKNKYRQTIKNYPIITADYSKFFWLKNPIAHSTVFFSKKFINSCQGYRDIPHMEDYDLWIRASSFKFKFFNLNLPTVIFNNDGVLARRKSLPALKSELKILKIKKEVLRLSLFKSYVAFLIRFFYYLIPFR